MNKVWPESEEWLRKCYVEREAIHGGSFTGNSCKLLLSKLNLLKELCPNNCYKYVHVFESFKNVIEACYGKHLHENYVDLINTFKCNYLNAGINVTPKVHAVFHHIKEFCQFSQSSLGPYSEQASEAVHYDFQQTWKNYKIKSMENPKYK